MTTETQIKNAISAERKDNRRRESIRSVLVVFVGIPGLVVLTVSAWLLLQRTGVI